MYYSYRFMNTKDSEITLSEFSELRIRIFLLIRKIQKERSVASPPGILTRYALLSTMVKNNGNLKELLKRSSSCLPPSLIPVMNEIADHIQVPSAATLSRLQMVLDASYCRIRHSKRLQN